MSKLYQKIIIFLIISKSAFGINTPQKEGLSKEKCEFTILIKKEDKETDFDEYYKYFIDLIGPVIAITGLIIAIPILRRKLLENHISKALIDIQDANKKLLLKTTDLIDYFSPKLYSNDRVLNEELEDVFTKIKEVYKLSQEGNSDSQTFLFFLKYTLQGTIKHYNPHEQSILYSRDIYGLIIEILEQVTYFSTQVVQIPKSTKTSNHNLINQEMKKYVTHSGFLKYKYFKQGLIDDPESAHYLIFYSKINYCSNTLLKRSAFQIFEDISAIKKIIYLVEIYAPLKLRVENRSLIFGDGYLCLYVIGYNISTQITMKDGATKKVVDIIYANPNDFGRFISGLTLEKLQEFEDDFIKESGFELSKAIKMRKHDIETFSLQFEFDYLKIQFERNKSNFKRKLKINNELDN